MPPLETDDLLQIAVLWELDSYDTYGKPTVHDPIEIPCRWVDVSEHSKRNVTTSESLDSKVSVDRAVPLGSIMWLGRLSDWTGVRPNPDEDNSVMVVSKYNYTPDIRAREIRRILGLNRFRDAWPSTLSTNLLIDVTLSSCTYSKTTAVANGVDEIAISFALRNMIGEPIEGRAIYAGLSSSNNISYDNSPQTTDINGNAVIIIRATGAATPTAAPYTVQDGAPFGGTDITFTAV